MNKMERNKLGLAGELRVMSELLIRGHNPAKSYLEDGADIILQNGIRVEVKSGHRCHINVRERGRVPRWRRNYLFTLKGGARSYRQNLNGTDFVVLWCIDDSCFFILPTYEIKSSAIGICSTDDNARNKYIQYKNRWDLLEVKE